MVRLGARCGKSAFGRETGQNTQNRVFGLFVGKLYALKSFIGRFDEVGGVWTWGKNALFGCLAILASFEV